MKRNFENMKIAIVVAMQKELNLLLSLFNNMTSCEIGGNLFYFGEYCDHEICVYQCGIGKVNAALRTYDMLRNFDADLVINSGVAGGLDASMHIGELLVADGVAYHDVWCGPGTDYGAADGFPVKMLPDKKCLEIAYSLINEEKIKGKVGLLCSGDTFIASPDEVTTIKGKFPEALGCDMESAAIAQTCISKGVPFLILRVMSDMPGGGENISEYQNFWNDAPQATFDCVTALISRLSE